MSRSTTTESPKSKAGATRKARKQRAAHAQPARTERLNARITPDDQILLAKVAGMRGISVSTFVIEAARPRAKALLRRRSLIRLSARDQHTLINALLSPPEPNAFLRSTAASHTQESARRSTANPAR